LVALHSCTRMSMKGTLGKTTTTLAKVALESNFCPLDWASLLVVILVESTSS